MLLVTSVITVDWFDSMLLQVEDFHCLEKCSEGHVCSCSPRWRSFPLNNFHCIH